MDSNDDANELELDQVSNGSVEDPLQVNQEEKSARTGDKEKWFVHIDKQSAPGTNLKKAGITKIGKRRSEVRRQLEVMIGEKKKALNLQIEVYTLQMEKERQQMEQNKKEHELKCNILEVKFLYNKDKMQLLKKQNVDS